MGKNEAIKQLVDGRDDVLTRISKGGETPSYPAVGAVDALIDAAQQRPWANSIMS
jgi:hypothetical protein